MRIHRHILKKFFPDAEQHLERSGIPHLSPLLKDIDRVAPALRVKAISLSNDAGNTARTRAHALRCTSEVYHGIFRPCAR